MIYILLFVYIIWLVSIIIYSIYLINSFFTDAPYVPVKNRVIKKIIESLKLKNNSVLYDLGCGDGRVLLEAIKNNDIRAIGVEKNFIVYILTKFFTRKTNIEIICSDIENISLRDATHIYLYLFPKIMDKLIAKISYECRPGTRIVSCSFKFSGLNPDEIIDLPKHKDKMCKTLYVYIIK